MPSLADIAVLATRWAVREGASEVETYIVSSKGYSATIRSNRVEGLEAIDEQGIGIRVAVGRKTGFAYSSSLEEHSIRRAIRQAIKQARASPEDPYWQGLPSPSPSYPEPQGIYSPGLAYMDPEALIEHLKEMVEKARSEKGAVLVAAGVEVEVVERVITNTNGVYRVDVGTRAEVAASVLISREGIVTPSIYEVEVNRQVMPDSTVVVERALEKAKLCLRKTRITEPKKTVVVFSPKTASELLSATLLAMLRGDMVVRGRSPFRDKLGAKVLDERLTIVDDGVLKAGYSTWRFDGEGVAMKKKVLVEKGVLKGFVYDTYWARRAGLEESTGNAVRQGYASRPQPGYTNIVIDAGDAAPDEILDGSEVYWIEYVQGAHTSNPETGEYSVLANPAILYRGGEPAGWVQGLVVSGRIYDELATRVEMVSRRVENPYPSFYLPAIRLAGITVAPKH
ncbi:MAG: TldD/PmbA family protein [Pyrodictiaceae archaeon]